MILVAKSGEIIFEQAYGLADRAENSAIKSDSAFQLASLSKPITSALILKLVEGGKLTLDATLAHYFPEFNNDFGKQVKIHHLLSHTSGLPNHFIIDGWFSHDFHKNTTEQSFIQLISTLTPKSSAGSEYHYSNLGYFLLGKISEKATGQSFAANLKKYITAPLNMAASGVLAGFEVPLNNVKGYQWQHGGGYREQSAKNMTLFGAGAGMYSNVRDLHRFDLALYDNTLLSDSSKKRLFNPENPYSWRVGKIPLTDDLEVNVHAYDGKFDGFSAMMTRFIDDQHSIILLSNTGMSYFLKAQLTLDIANIIYSQDTENRENNATLKLINAVVNGSFDAMLSKITSGEVNFSLNEQSLSALAFELLWSNEGENALQLFSFIAAKYPSSASAKANLLQACNHRLTKNAKSNAVICHQQ